MNMNMLLLLFYQVLDITFGFQFKCPAPGQWRFRARKIFCLQGYVCLLQSPEKTYQETCDGIDYSSSGSKLIFQPNFNKADCSYQRYQPFPFSTEENSNCVYQKSFCNEEGQIVNTVGSLINDTTCECDLSKGYRFVNKPKHNCYCSPSQEDCSCYKFDCIDEDTLCPNNGAAFWNISCPKIKTRISQNVSLSSKGRLNGASNIISNGRTNRLYCFWFVSVLLMIVIIYAPLQKFRGWPASFYKDPLAQNYRKKTEPDYLKTDSNTDLLKAVEQGNLELVRYYYKEGSNGLTPLIKAAEAGHLDIVAYLVQNGCDINEQDRQRGFTALIAAAMTGYLKIVTYLVNKGCKKEIKDKIEWTALIHAIGKGHLDVVKFLLEPCSYTVAKASHTYMIPLLQAAEDGYFEIVKYLVENGCNKEAIETQNERTSLMLAAEKGNLDIVEYLVTQKCNTEARDKPDKKTALHLAAENGELEVTKWLIEEAGIDPSVQTSKGKTPYDLAKRKRSTDHKKKIENRKQVRIFIKKAIKDKHDKQKSRILESNTLEEKDPTQEETEDRSNT